MQCKTNNTNKNLINNLKMAEYIHFEVENFAFRTIIFLLCLLFDLGYRHLWFASMTNLEAGPRFADMWSAELVSKSANRILTF